MSDVAASSSAQTAKAWPPDLPMHPPHPSDALIAVAFSLLSASSPSPFFLTTDPSPTAELSVTMAILDGLPIKVSPNPPPLSPLRQADTPAAQRTPHHTTTTLALHSVQLT